MIGKHYKLCMFGAIKSMIRQETIARSLPPRLMSSESSLKDYLGLLTKQIVDVNPKIS